METSIADLLRKLTLNEDVLQTLLKIKAFIVGSPTSSIKNVVQASHLSSLFDCLNTNNKEQVEVSCYILSSLLPLVDHVSVITELSDALQNGLKHPVAEVQLLVLQELHRIIATTEGRNSLIESPQVIRIAVKLIGDADLSIASASIKFLSDFGRTSPTFARVLLSSNGESHLDLLKSVMGKSDEIRYRVFELVCSIQSESQDMLNLCVQSGIVDRLLKDLFGNDMLLKVSCCAMLADMASSKHSLDYLSQSGVVSQMIELLKRSSEDPLSSLYIPGVLKFFGNLCFYCGPEKVMNIFPGYYDLLFSLLNEGDENAQRVSIETIGVVARTAEGKLLLHGLGKKCVSAVQRICRVVLTGTQDLRLHAVNTMCQLLDTTHVDNEEIERVLLVTLSWFRLISDDPIDSVVTLCKQPFPAIRASAMNLLKTIASCEWGLEAMVELPTLTEYLLDRSTETDKECKEAKYEVVVALSRSKRCANIFGNQNYLKLRQFVNEGAFYVDTEVNVAIEDAS